jgi:hypothetical protein
MVLTRKTSLMRSRGFLSCVAMEVLDYILLTMAIFAGKELHIGRFSYITFVSDDPCLSSFFVSVTAVQ